MTLIQTVMISMAVAWPLLAIYFMRREKFSLRDALLLGWCSVTLIALPAVAVLLFIRRRRKLEHESRVVEYAQTAFRFGLIAACCVAPVLSLVMIWTNGQILSRNRLARATGEPVTVALLIPPTPAVVDSHGCTPAKFQDDAGRVYDKALCNRERVPTSDKIEMIRHQSELFFAEELDRDSALWFSIALNFLAANVCVGLYMYGLLLRRKAPNSVA